jgi:hypothetical protein
MTATHILRTRVTIETRHVVESIARQQQLTESAWLRRLIETTLQSTSTANGARLSDAADHRPRQARLTIRLLPEDQVLLEARANARGMPAATYASMALRSHLRALAPLPKEEREALKRAIGELSSIGRNLNQIARSANQGRVAGPSREELRALFRACEGLRDHVRRLLDANLRSWETGHAEARH